MRTSTEQRFLGCLLGDALGAPVEFMFLAEIRKRFGPDGIADYAPAYGGVGTITDDTQMTLWTAERLLAVNHGGDSTGAITGNIPGVLLGRNAIPRKSLDRLELHAAIETVATALWDRCPMSLT